MGPGQPRGAGRGARRDDRLAAITGKSASVIARGKRVFHEQIDRGLEAAYAHAGEAMACTLLTAEAAEGIAAFTGKRAPRWPGQGDGS